MDTEEFEEKLKAARARQRAYEDGLKRGIAMGVASSAGGCALAMAPAYPAPAGALPERCVPWLGLMLGSVLLLVITTIVRRSGKGWRGRKGYCPGWLG